MLEFSKTYPIGENNSSKEPGNNLSSKSFTKAKHQDPTSVRKLLLKISNESKTIKIYRSGNSVKKSERPTACQEKWHKDINLSLNESINRKVAYQTSFKCTKSTKLITFNFKLLHRQLPTNSFLKKVGLRDDDKCTFCHKEIENLIHLFWRCKKQKNFGIVFSNG